MKQLYKYLISNKYIHFENRTRAHTHTHTQRYKNWLRGLFAQIVNCRDITSLAIENVQIFQICSTNVSFFAISTNKQTREGVKKLKLTKLKTCPQLTNKLILAIAEYCLANWKYKRNNIHSLQRKKAICTNTLQQQWTQPKSICKSQNPIKYQQILKGPLGFLSRPLIQITSNQIMFFKRKEHFFCMVQAFINLRAKKKGHMSLQQIQHPAVFTSNAPPNYTLVFICKLPSFRKITYSAPIKLRAV